MSFELNPLNKSFQTETPSRSENSKTETGSTTASRVWGLWTSVYETLAWVYGDSEQFIELLPARNLMPSNTKKSLLSHCRMKTRMLPPKNSFQ